MICEGDMQDVNNINPFHIDDTDDDDDAVVGYFSDDDNDAGANVDSEFLEVDDLLGSDQLQKNFTVLKSDAIQRGMEHDIAQVSTVLSVSKVEASILLRSYNWNIGKVHDAWFADESGVRKKVGLLEKTTKVDPFLSNIDSDLSCGICFESYPRDGINSAACGHPFCSECWVNYISTSINDGSGCLVLRCPEPSCVAAVGDDMINSLASVEDKERYFHFLYRSYVEDNKKRKWCPGPGCEFAVEFVAGDGNFDVSCLCSHSFCWNCTEEIHRPVDCATVRKWVLKNKSDSANVNYIILNTKPCPKCKRPIEKNMGCMRMTCSAPCRYQFCWLCLNDWSVHGYNPCNRYKETDDESKRKKEMAKLYLERYGHYWERWAANQVSREKALEDLQEVQSSHIKKLSDIQCQPETQLSFITNAWQQIIECRQVLKWTYAYGYYIPQGEDAKRQLFEYLQGQAESGLERLHQCAEQELKQCLKTDGPSEKFVQFRSKLTGLTSVTKNYFKNLVRALENGLSEVACQGACGPSEVDCEAASSSKKRSIYPDPSEDRVRRNARIPKAHFIAPQTDNGTVANSKVEGAWACEFCTYVNGSHVMTCALCHRGSWTCPYCTYANPRSATTCLACQEDQ